MNLKKLVIILEGVGSLGYALGGVVNDYRKADKKEKANRVALRPVAVHLATEDDIRAAMAAEDDELPQADLSEFDARLDELASRLAEATATSQEAAQQALATAQAALGDAEAASVSGLEKLQQALRLVSNATEEELHQASAAAAEAAVAAAKPRHPYENVDRDYEGGV